jgi:hypothetical protein
MRVFDAIGQLVYSGRTNSSTTQIDLHSLHFKGLVLVQVISVDGILTTKII